MIARIWHGETQKQNARAYEELLRTKVFPGIQKVPGAKGAYLLRRDRSSYVEFITITLFDSLDAVRAFAGTDCERAVILPEAHTLLTRFDERSQHFEVALAPS